MLRHAVYSVHVHADGGDRDHPWLSDKGALPSHGREGIVFAHVWFFFPVCERLCVCVFLCVFFCVKYLLYF